MIRAICDPGDAVTSDSWDLRSRPRVRLICTAPGFANRRLYGWFGLRLAEVVAGDDVCFGRRSGLFAVVAHHQG